MPFDTKTLGYYFTGYNNKLIQISTKFMMPFLFKVIQYHADDSSKVITQSKMSSFVLKHLVSNTLANFS